MIVFCAERRVRTRGVWHNGVWCVVGPEFHACPFKAKYPSSAPQWCRHHNPVAVRRTALKRIKQEIERLEAIGDSVEFTHQPQGEIRANHKSGTSGTP